MNIQNAGSSLEYLNPDQIRPNPENPRMIFREAELNELLLSIQGVGIRVPLTVYRDGSHFVILDGERRWRCARRLNLKVVPAIIHPKPTRLENILMMFNIHNVRVNWDMIAMAYKLRDVQTMLAGEGQPSTPRDVAGLTGLSISTVRRCFELLDLPQKYQDMLVEEALKPRDKQKVTVDLFAEVLKARNTIRNYQPQVFKNIREDEFLDAMVEKYSSGVINNVVKFRDLSRIARASRAGESDADVGMVIEKVINQPNYSIDRAYQESVQHAYQNRDLSQKVVGLLKQLDAIKAEELAPSALTELRRLRDKLNAILDFPDGL
jgi:ParB family transcriptional regulator, chromosome partitioning protein